jgi:mitosis inhibitor protein kinase SWE1
LGFIHLDLKPANVLITFEGVLKIGDFGMAVNWPAQPGIDGEGDREYIGPEILMGQFDKPADIFALGLIMLEIAGNVMLPDNGASWQRLRTGDMSDVPSLTWSSEDSKIFRDSSGKPLSDKESLEEFYGSDSGGEDFGSPNFHRRRREGQKKSHFQLRRSGELAEPPAFMIDAKNQEALDGIVRWMISPRASDRPVVDQILRTAGVQWAEVRRRAGATIYEGNWGPADEVLADDAEMIDV